MISFLAQPAHPRAAMLAVLVLMLGACRAPSQAPLDAEALARSVAQRSATPQELAAALELCGLRPLALTPPSPDVLEDPSAPEFWHSCAWVWSPAMRAARRRLEAARAAAGSAGQPGPIEGMVEVEDLGEVDAATKLAVTFDLFGLLGLGPAGTARALADAETRAALGALETAMWSTRFEVDAARMRLAALRSAQEELNGLVQEAETGEIRIAILERHGRVSVEALAMARLALKRLGERQARLAGEEAQAREALALATGLADAAAALDAPNKRTLDELPAIQQLERPTAEDLLTRLPELRAVLLDYAIAEARLRDEAAQRWPSLQLGPQLLWTEPDVLLGAVVASGLPWPGAIDGRIAAARVEREAARERVEDALLAAELRCSAAQTRHTAADTLLTEGARPAAEEGARVWTAARAAFAADPAALLGWATALAMRAETLESLALARGELAQAALEFERSAGPGPEVPRLVRASEARP